MDPNSSTPNEQKTDIKTEQSISILQNIKSNYFLERIYDNILKKKSLEIVKYNKRMQNRISLSIKDYKEYSEKFTPIEIEIIPVNNQYSRFINIKENEKIFYHIFFNDNKEEIENKYSINKEDKVTKIKIVIDYQVKSFENLFKNCEFIKSINFIKFHRNIIDNMGFMFFGCSLLEELNLSNFKTDNVSDMRGMFNSCKSLKKLDLFNFDTSNVNNMEFMFNECPKLKEIKGINNFNTSNVTDMKAMFQDCKELEYLDLSNFNTSNINDMRYMFVGCNKLKEIKGINNFNTSKVTNMTTMFRDCNELEYLDLSNFNTSNVNDMRYMFV